MRAHGAGRVRLAGDQVSLVDHDSPPPLPVASASSVPILRKDGPADVSALCQLLDQTAPI